MTMTTKEKIIEQATILFAQKGYDGVSVRDIASMVEIRESALYRHFKNKQDIFDTIIEQTSQKLTVMQERLVMPSGGTRSINEMCNFDRLYQTGCNLFLFYLKDQEVGQLRKMLTLEQYRGSEHSTLFGKFFFNNTLQLQATLFKQFIDMGYFILCDPYTAAMQFYAPIFVLILQYDVMPDREVEGLVVLKNHIREFCRHYIRIK